MQKMRSLFFGSLMTITVTGFSQQVKINVKTGDKYKVQTIVNLSSVAELMGQSMETTLDQKSNTTYEIAAITTDGIAMQSTITKMDVKTMMMGQESNFDSEKDNNSGPLADLFSPMINKVANLTIDNKGIITRQEKDENAAALAALTGGGGNENNIDLFISVLIGRELKIGDVFPDSSSTTGEKNSSKTSGIYTIKSIEKGVATISYTGTEVSSMTMEQMGMEVINNSTNKITSEIQVDMETGIMMEKTTLKETTNTIEVGGMSIPGTGKSTIAVKVSKK
ncbi:MAG: hypothetical protein HOP10_10730 [Chitinophagaceae bacterium]|nr:hypothetical protein [Chitinophagaceae bacterium]